jgi:hypothetical protein
LVAGDPSSNLQNPSNKGLGKIKNCKQTALTQAFYLEEVVEGSQ